MFKGKTAKGLLFYKEMTEIPFTLIIIIVYIYIIIYKILCVCVCVFKLEFHRTERRMVVGRGWWWFGRGGGEMFVRRCKVSVTWDQQVPNGQSSYSKVTTVNNTIIYLKFPKKMDTKHSGHKR